MDDHFLENVRQTIKKTRGLTIGGLAIALGKSEAQTYRILNGSAPYQVHYTRAIKDYVGLGSPIDRQGNQMAALDLVDLKTAYSLEEEKDVICRMTVPEEMLPRGMAAEDIKIVKMIGDHCAPEYKQGDYVFINTAQKLPEPPGVFLLWTGMGYKFQFCEHILSSAPPLIRISSPNKQAAYAPAETPLSKLSLKGRVFGKISMQIG